MVAFASLWGAVEAIAAPVLHRLPGYQVVWSRYAVHLALMLAVWGWREPSSLWRTHRPGFQMARSMLMLGMPASWILAMEHGIRPHALMAVFWLSPLLILSIAHAWCGDRARPAVWLAASVAFAGALLLHPPTGFESMASLALPLGMALSFSLYAVMTRALRGERLRANLFWTALGVCAVLTPAMPFVWTPPSSHDALVLAAVGVLGFLALAALDRAAHAAPLSVTAPFIYLQIPVLLGLLIAAGADIGLSPRRAALAVLLIVGSAGVLWVFESHSRAATARAAGAHR